jgi:tetratricopeptide (TPR) repeat protein/transcriptional regulator with XRE-family HTH domain
MPTFGELLNQYIERAGITDAELARSTGLQRQTIFRWKEGLTARPRYREDVIRIAARLRLSPSECDALLLAAGFPPNSPAAGSLIHSSSTPENAALEDADLDQDGASPPPVLPSPPVSIHRSRLIDRPDIMLVTAAAMILVIAVAGTFLLRAFIPPAPSTPNASTPVALTFPTAEVAAALTARPIPTATPIAAQPGEQLIVIAPFVGYTSSDIRFNIAGRIREAVEEEIQRAQLEDVRVVIWPEPVADSEQAETLLTASGAVLAIWGEYDAGRVRAGLSTPLLEDAFWINPVDAPSALPLVINEDVPRDARIFALYTLGSYYRATDEVAKALAAYQRALAQTPTDPATLASLHFYVGLLTPQVSGYTTQSLTESIYHYTNSLALQPAWENVRYNRGTSYLGRALLSLDERADLDAAIADLDVVILRRPARIDPLINRGIAYYQRNSAGDLDAARADFSRAIELQPADYQAYYHRALVEIRGGETASWQADLARVQSLAPQYAPARNAFCWGYAIAGEAATALPYCDAAVASDPTGASLDSRAIALAQLERHADAAADLRAYLDWVRTDFPDIYEKYRGPRVESWIEALERGENPFTPEVLDALRTGAD